MSNTLPQASASHTFTLAAPITRGETAIEALTIRKPSAGQLRGLSLQSLLSLDITAILTVTPRITMPPITQAEADELDPADLAEIGGAIRDFFMTQAERRLLEMMIEQNTPKS
ncbi:phage tail assembly protein [Novosphingobium humi]|uniref:phage tail assembly protein n=1 Tax=Novosphingobium humi TaxID=2282397 RepID=UPI0025B02210|nr:phage tail assembly protein [Novosphingobium humi]WJS98216.1 phage tail assembly protein [Novosphingobium humi]